MTPFGTFIDPDDTLISHPDPASALDIEIYSGHQAKGDMDRFLGRNSIFDKVCSNIRDLTLNYENQCSLQYYYDLVMTLRDLNGSFDRVVEVGVFMGGASSYFAGCMQHFDFDLDLVDLSPKFLRFTYERIRRMYPDSTGKIRLFCGDLPSYVRHVMMEENDVRHIIHHDGAHDFNQVVKDLAALSFVRKKVHAIIAQDTHLRGTIHHMNFVDMALYAVFGTDLKFAPIGSVYDWDDEMTRPNRYQGNYFMPGVAEGIVLPMDLNTFNYPHPNLSAEDFLPAARMAA